MKFDRLEWRWPVIEFNVIVHALRILMSGGEGFGSRILFQLQHRPAHMDDIPFK
jgi:hypothetical protein